MNKGFTLVELAIVIVIIGLLVGGVLQGQELINQAKIRAQIKQFQEYDTASLTFKAKTNFIPGDIPYSLRTQFGVTACNFGFEGNGKIDFYTGPSSTPPPTAWCESAMYFLNLRELKLIKDNIYYVASSYSVGDRWPEDKFGKGGIAVVQMADALYYYMGPTRKNDTSNNSGYFYLSPNPSVSPAQASGIDTKIDDGIPSQGMVRAVTVHTSDPLVNMANDTVTGNCLGTTNQLYNSTTPDDALCRIIVKSKAL